MNHKLALLTLFFAIATTFSCKDDNYPITPNTPSAEEKDDDDNNVVDNPHDFSASDAVLFVDGRFLKDKSGNIVNLHGIGQTYSPWFNEQGSQWNNYDVDACLTYNKAIINKILKAGWAIDFVRFHMDPYWSNTPGVQTTGENDISAYSEVRFKKYLDEVFAPMVDFLTSKGLFVVMRPPGVCPHEIAVDDDYNRYLVSVWSIVANHKRLWNNPMVSFELANEPVSIMGSDGSMGASNQGHFDQLKIYFQKVVDAIRATGAENILWVPGLGYQGLYWGFANNPIEGKNIGYAVHCYPGWMGSDGENGDGGISDNGGYASFQNGWNQQVQPIADLAPVMVTEMDWMPQKYNASWGKALTGTAGGAGFGANFKYITDQCGNVSWMIFTSPDILARYTGAEGKPGSYNMFNDPEACIWPVYHWFKDYREGISGDVISLSVGGVENDMLSLREGTSWSIIVNAITSTGSSYAVDNKEIKVSTDNPNLFDIVDGCRLVALSQGSAIVTISVGSISKNISVSVENIFSLLAKDFDPNIWETGSYDEASQTLITGQYGFGGWRFGSGVDLSGYKSLTVELGADNTSMISFRLFDQNNYWSKPAMFDFNNSRKITIDLHNMKNEEGQTVDPSHIFIAGFWSLGGKEIVIKSIKLE
ncbi:MAG: cellulase family glycosylhydrolase [Marinilabiliaceae bacterium]|nr:cellulase family glycosylhydrolase [Marinilabiliaceae bacterium]